ncbi:MAG: Putative Fe-only hydrogenase, partial [candidate division WS6 bacterium 34_10]
MELKGVTTSENTLTSILKNEWIQITLLTLLSISAPLLIKSPQLLVGSIVNFVLFFSAKRYGFKKSLPSILLPSLVAYSSNILFGGATYFLIFFVPIIFLGNSIYVLLSRYIKNRLLSVFVASVCKSLLLFVFAFVFVEELGLPQIFLSSMGVMQ